MRPSVEKWLLSPFLEYQSRNGSMALPIRTCPCYGNTGLDSLKAILDEGIRRLHAAQAIMLSPTRSTNAWVSSVGADRAAAFVGLADMRYIVGCV